MRIIKYSGSLENLSNKLSLINDDSADIPDGWRVVPEEEYDWKVRLFLEWHDLTDKHNRLFLYIKNESLATMPSSEFKLLMAQYKVMQDYTEILSQRLVLAGVI